MSDQNPNAEGRRLVERMTNRQRNRWARAGYPGLSGSNYQPERIRPFVPGEVHVVERDAP